MRWTTIILAPVLLTLPACLIEADPEVEVRAVVGQQRSNVDPAQTWADATAVLNAAFAPKPTAAHEAAPTAASPGALIVRPPRDAKQFERALAAARDGDIEDLASVARNLAQSPVAVWPQVAAALADEGKGSKLQHKRILDLIGGDVPNRYGHFDRHWKREHGYHVKLSENWFEDLLALPLPKVARSMHPVYRELVVEVALMHAAAKIAREEPELASEVVDTLIEVAYAKDGTFRDEVGRAIQAIGEPAVPQLIRRTPLPTHNPRLQDEIPVRQAKYAAFVLDQMDRMHPSRAIENCRGEPELLANVLSAYGEAKFGDAASYLLEHFDAPSPMVRDAARTSFLTFVTGPPPRVRATKVRTLGGGVTTRAGHLTYRGLATLAIRDALERHAPELLETEPPCEVRREDGSYDQKCIEQPLRLTKAYVEHLETLRRSAERETLARAFAQESEDPDAAMRTVNELLATGVGSRYVEELSPFLARAIERSQAQSDPRRTAQLTRKLANMVAEEDPERARRLRARAFVHESRAEGLSSRGRHMLLATAAELAPTDPVVAAASVGDHAERISESIDGRLVADLGVARRRLWQGFFGLALLFAALASIAGRLRRWADTSPRTGASA